MELAWLFLKPDTGLDHCPRILLMCFRARTTAPHCFMTSPHIFLARSSCDLAAPAAAPPPPAPPPGCWRTRARTATKRKTPLHSSSARPAATRRAERRRRAAPRPSPASSGKRGPGGNRRPTARDRKGERGGQTLQKSIWKDMKNCSTPLKGEE